MVTAAQLVNSGEFGVEGSARHSNSELDPAESCADGLAFTIEAQREIELKGLFGWKWNEME